MKLYKVVTRTKPKGAITQAEEIETHYIACGSIKEAADKFKDAEEIKLITDKLQCLNNPKK
jgi:hypothetical protein